MEAIKHGMDQGFHELAVQADEFQGNHQDGAPMPGTGDVVLVPKSRSLRKLLESDGMLSLAERALGWKAAAPAPSAGGEKRKAAQPSGAAKAKAKAKKSKSTSGVGFFPPPWACRAAWYGDTCRRNECQYDHVNGITYTAGLAAPTAASGQPRQQQQTQQQIQQPQQQLQQQPQQQQPQTAAGGGVQQPSVANFSRMVGGGRGGGGVFGGATEGRGGAGRCGF